MHGQSRFAAMLRDSIRVASRPAAWAVLLSVCIFCTLCGVLGAFVLPQTLLGQLVKGTHSQVPAPTTPAVFGLSGQATCQSLDPPTASPWLSVARADAEKYQLDTLAFEWQIWRESKFNPDAASAAGAIGIAQFEPATAASLGIDPRDPEQALDAAARLDQSQLRQFAEESRELAAHYGGQSAHYGYGFMLAAYNAGASAVESAWNDTYNDQDIDLWPDSAWDWLEHLHSETRSYVPAVLGCL
jgi:hypothetical protein